MKRRYERRAGNSTVRGRVSLLLISLKRENSQHNNVIVSRALFRQWIGLGQGQGERLCSFVLLELGVGALFLGL